MRRHFARVLLVLIVPAFLAGACIVKTKPGRRGQPVTHKKHKKPKKHKKHKDHGKHKGHDKH